MSFTSQIREVARVDLVVERRTGETFRIVLPFAIVTLIIFSLSLGGDVAILRTVGPAVFWAVSVLFGMQLALRASALDSPTRRDLMLLLDLDPAARFLGRTLASATIVLVFMTVLFATMVVLFDPSLPGGWFWPVAAAISLAAIGLAALSTLAGGVAAGTRNRSSLASLIVAPLAIPVVVGGSQVLEAMERNSGILLWILLLITSDLALLVAGVGLSRPLEEASR
ncbi:MAG TPA: heme exporter protein CcmB [Acidimicrobiia bacterium]